MQLNVENNQYSCVVWEINHSETLKFEFSYPVLVRTNFTKDTYCVVSKLTKKIIG